MRCNYDEWTWYDDSGYVCKEEPSVRTAGPVTKAVYYEDIDRTAVWTDDGACYYLEGNVLNNVLLAKKGHESMAEGGLPDGPMKDK